MASEASETDDTGFTGSADPVSPSTASGEASDGAGVSRSRRNIRAELVSAALDLFYERGYEATGVADIVNRAGCTKGALYHYFESKEALLNQIHDDFIGDMLDRAIEIRNEQLSPTAALSLMLQDLMVKVAQRRAEFTVAFLETRVDRERYPGAGETMQQWRSILTDIIDEGRRSKEFRSDVVPRVATYGIIGMCVWAAFHWFPEQSDLPPRGVAEQFIDLAVQGLASRD